MCDGGDGGIDAHQDGDILLWDALRHESADGVGHQTERLFLVVFCRQERDLHLSLCGLPLGHALCYVVIGAFQLFCLCLVEFALGLIFQFYGLQEELIVEVDDVALRTVVRLQRKGLYLSAVELLLDVVEQSPVARAPAVDALLHVAHDEVGSSLMTHGFVEQHAEILPLHGGGVLELVDHHMLQLGADLLEDEGRVAAVDERVQQLLGITEQETVGSLVELVHLLLDAAQQAQLVEVAKGEVCRLV